MSKTQYIGAEGAAWERLGLVFEAMGYRRPQPWHDQAGGNYVRNIIDQYQSDFDEDEILEIIQFARRSREDLHAALDGMSHQEAEYMVLPHRESLEL